LEGTIPVKLNKSTLLLMLVVLIPLFTSVRNVEAKPRAVKLIVEGDLGYIMLLDDPGLYIVNLSDPSNPEFVSYMKLAGYSVSEMIVDSDYVYISCQLDYNPMQFAVHIIDVSTPKEPELVKTYVHSTQYFAHNIFVTNNLLFLVVNDMLKIVDVSSPSTPYELGFYSAHSVFDVFVVGNKAYITCGDDGLKILDISTPSSPSLLGGYLSDNYYSLLVDGNYAFIPIATTVYRLDVTNPAAINYAGSFDRGSYANFLVVNGFLYYVMYGTLFIVEFTTISPSIVGNHVFTQSYYYFDVQGDYVYCIEEEIEIVDISDKSDPVYVGTFKLWFPHLRTRNIIIGAIPLVIVSTIIALIVWRRDNIKDRLERSRAQRATTLGITTTHGKMHKAVKISLIASVASFVASLAIIIGVQSWDFWTGIPICLSLGPISIAVLCLAPLITWVVVQVKKKQTTPTPVVSTEQITEVAEEKQEGMVFCPSCGKQISAEYKHCPKCGYKL